MTHTRAHVALSGPRCFSGRAVIECGRFADSRAGLPVSVVAVAEVKL